MPDVENVIIIGSGPAGYTAALYTARANLNPLVIEGFLWGGLLQQTTDVENYPGYPQGVMGPQMMQDLRDQAERFGSRFITENVTRFEPGADGEPHTVWVDDEVYKARAVILAMGAEHKKLGVPGEEELGGRGVSYCATCDAAFFKDRATIIVGGGDSAMEEAIFLAKFSSKVVIVNRRDEFRASKIMLERARATENIEFQTPFVVEEFLAGDNGALDRARLRNIETGETRGAADVRRVHRDRPRAAVGDRRRASSTPTRTATSPPRASPRAPTCRACSRPATSSTTPTARRSPPPARAAGRAGRRVVPARQPGRADPGGARGHRRPRRGSSGRPAPLAAPERERGSPRRGCGPRAGAPSAT